MNKKRDFKEIVKETQKVLNKQSPTILTTIGIIGMFTAGIVAVSATPKALLEIDKKRLENSKKEKDFIYEDLEGSKLSKKEIISVTWKFYVPALITSGLSTACLIGASSINARRITAIATAYRISDVALTEYKQKVVDTVGVKKEQSIRDSIAKDKVEKNQSDKTIIMTGKGSILCMDAISGQYFTGDIEKIQHSVNVLNRRMMDEMYISLNDFYYEIGMRGTSVGDDLGWNISNGLIELDLSSQLMDDNTPCLVIDYKLTPKYDFSKLY